ncbi:MAG: hypothetical protein J7L39_00440 [Candidatus Aenigmarchaeota archaeon]|nr:hypothetical protein [Candidatus Aenigmarchaeota archaeon]
MKKERFTLIGLIICLLSVLNVDFAFASNLSPSYSLADTYIYPNSETSLTLTLTNLASSEVEDIKVNVSSEDLKVYPSSFSVEKLPSQGSTQVSFLISSPLVDETGYKIIKVSIEYELNARTYVQTLDIPLKVVSVPSVDITSFKINSSEPKPGDYVKLKLYVSNQGEGLAKDVRLILNQTIFISKENEILIKELLPYETKYVSVEGFIDPNLSPNLYSIPITITYYDSSKTFFYSDVRFIPLKVYSEPNLVLSLGAEPKTYVGKNAQVELRIANAGRMRMKFLTIRVTSKDLKLVPPQEIYVGNIEPDDYTIERIEFSTENLKPGIYSALLSLKYEDVFGKTYVQNKTIDITVLPPEREVGFGSIYLIFLLLIILGFLILRILRKRRK